MTQPNLTDLAKMLGNQADQRLFEQRIVIVSEGIHSGVAERVIKELLALDAMDPKRDITMILNSPGGEVSSGYAIHDMMRFIRPDVRVVVSGLAASIATVILMGAPKAKRLSLPNSRLLIHQPLIGGHVQGQASDLEITAREIMKTREKIAKLYHEETGQPLEKVQRDIERDYWMSAAEALDYGLISRICVNWNEALSD